MKQIKNDSVNQIVRNLIKKDLINLNFTIAGGFAVWLYSLTRSPELLERIRLSTEKIKTAQNYGFDVSLYIKYVSSEFTDIDFWITSKTSLTDDVKKFLFDNKNSTDAFASTPILTDDKRYTLSNSFGIANHPYRQSEYANTFNSLQYGFSSPSQFIKKEYDSEEDILNGFDMDICRVGWNNDTLFVDERAEAAFNAKEISTELSESYSTNIIRLQRCFKYSTRYSFEFSKKLIDDAFSIYMQMFEEREKRAIQKKQLQWLPISIGTTPAISTFATTMSPQPIYTIGSNHPVYSTSTATVTPYWSSPLQSNSQMMFDPEEKKKEYIYRIEDALINNIQNLFLMKGFEKHHATYFLESKDQRVDQFLKMYLKPVE